MALVAGGRMSSAQRPSGARPVYVPYGVRARSFGGMFALHFLLAGIAAFGAETLPSAGWAYAALLIFCSMCFGLLRSSPATFLLFVTLLALRVTEFISGAAIESGAYMIETTTYGQPTGAFTRLLLIYLLFFLTATFIVELTWPRLKIAFRDAPERWERQAPLIWKALLVLFLVTTVYLIRLAINNGTPLFDHIDRFSYLEKIDSPIYQAFLRNRVVVIPFIGVLFALPSYRMKGVILLVWMLAASIVFGEKFTSLLMIISIFAIPAGLHHVANDRPIPVNTLVMISVAIVTITIPAVLIAYGALTDFDAAAERYGQRVALQGQLWYVTDHKYLSTARFDYQAISADMSSWLSISDQDASAVGTRFGLYYVMERFTSSRLLGWSMEGGTGFVFSFYPYLLLSMGLIGLLIVSSLVAVYHAFLMRMLAASFARANWLAALAFGRVMSSIYGTYSSGYLWNILGVKSLITFAVGLFLMWEGERKQSVTRRYINNLAGVGGKRARRP